VAEALGTLSNGWAGTRAADEERGRLALPRLAVNGMYTGGDAPGLLAGPRWDQLAITATDDDPPNPAEVAGTERMIDLRTGVLVRRDATGLRTFRFLSAVRPEALALRAEAPAARLLPGPGLAPPGDATAAPAFEHRRRHGADLARVQTPGDGGITMAARDRDRVVDARRVVERLAAWTAARSRAPAWAGALEAVDELEGVGSIAFWPSTVPRGRRGGPMPTSASTGRPVTSWRLASPCSTCWRRPPTRARLRWAPGA
jgi:hypothetical protein